MTAADWRDEALCAGMVKPSVHTGFTELPTNEQKMLCRVCPVKAECLADGLKIDAEYEVGYEGGPVYGGLTQKERRDLTRQQASA